MTVREGNLRRIAYTRMQVESPGHHYPHPFTIACKPELMFEAYIEHLLFHIHPLPLLPKHPMFTVGSNPGVLVHQLYLH